jgi:hypothetical protein
MRCARTESSGRHSLAHHTTGTITAAVADSANAGASAVTVTIAVTAPHTHANVRAGSRSPTPAVARGLCRRKRAPKVKRLQLRQVVQRLGYRRATLSAQVVPTANRVDGKRGRSKEESKRGKGKGRRA